MVCLGAAQSSCDRLKLPVSVVEKPSDHRLEMTIEMVPAAVAGNVWVNVVDE